MSAARVQHPCNPISRTVRLRLKRAFQCISLILALWLGLTTQGIAAPVSYTFGGTLNGAFGTLSAGTPFSGYFRYDTDAAPVISWPEDPPHITQNYPFEAFEIYIDGQTIAAVPGSDFRNNISFGIEGSNSHRVGIDANEYATGGPDIVATGPVGGVADIVSISFLLDDGTKTALSGTDPAESLALADFATYRLIYIGSYLNEHFVSGTVTHLAPVPLPAALPLFLFGLFSVVIAGRKLRHSC